MTQQRDGGPAFPGTTQGEVDVLALDGRVLGKGTGPVEYPGMSLHDWFTGQAMTGVFAGFVHQHGYMPETAAHWESIARKAGIYADHMMYNREEK